MGRISSDLWHRPVFCNKISLEEAQTIKDLAIGYLCGWAKGLRVPDLSSESILAYQMTGIAPQ